MTALIAVLIVVVPLILVDAARRDAEAEFAPLEADLHFDGIRFDKQTMILFDFRGRLKVDSISDMEYASINVQWSLYPWQVFDSELN